MGKKTLIPLITTILLGAVGYFAADMSLAEILKMLLDKETAKTVCDTLLLAPVL